MSHKPSARVFTEKHEGFFCLWRGDFRRRSLWKKLDVVLLKHAFFCWLMSSFLFSMQLTQVWKMCFYRSISNYVNIVEKYFFFPCNLISKVKRFAWREIKFLVILSSWKSKIQYLKMFMGLWCGCRLSWTPPQVVSGWRWDSRAAIKTTEGSQARPDQSA